jgi:hypothetical protein
VLPETSGDAEAAALAEVELFGRNTTNAVMIRPTTITAPMTVPPFLRNSRRRRDAARAAAAFRPSSRRSRLPT